MTPAADFGSDRVSSLDYAAESTRESDHRIANNLGMIASLVRLEAREVSGKTAIEGVQVGKLLNEVAMRIEAVGRLHRVLAKHPTEGNIDCGAFLRSICTSAADALDPRTTLEFDLPEDCQAPAARTLLLGLIVNEAVTNAIKHAHPTKIPAQITVICRREAGDGLLLVVQDDGVGLPPGFKPANQGGLGFRIMHSLAEQCSAKLTHTSTPLGYRLQIVV